jgi:ASC-1-like (ASCH) protein
MLDAEGYEKMVPNAETIDEAHTVYNRIPGYKQQVKKFGAVAFKVRVVKK